MEKISIIIPSKNEEEYIAECLESIVKSDYPKDYLEVFVVDGNSTDATRAIIMEYSQKYDFIKLLINKNKTVPFAMNMGIKNSKGNYIIRLDAHCSYPSDYLSKLISWSKKLNADNVGSIIITDVRIKNHKSLSIKTVLSNKFGVGNSLFRVGTNKIKEVDTVPFGCYKKEVFDKIGLYDVRLDRDQDIELNKRIKRNGGKIFLISEVSSTYYARESFYELAKNNFQTGYWNILTVYLTRRVNSLSIRHFIPLIFLLSLVIPLSLYYWIGNFVLLSLASFCGYISSVIIVSLQINNKSTSLFFLMWSFITLHFSYGFGSLIGIFRIDKLFK